MPDQVRHDYLPLLPITYYLLPITYYLLPITYYLLPITYYLLPITYYLLPITHHQNVIFPYEANKRSRTREYSLRG
ncbi:MAG: hypothetical protein C1941_04660 [Prosthecochloris sp.]|nr:hypothetical protein [Prosthecochloris sp.]